MKKGRIIIVAILIMGLLTIAAYAKTRDQNETLKKNASWGRYLHWTVMLKNGKLWAQGTHGIWKNKSYVIDRGVLNFWVTGTGLGPVVVYKQGDLLYVAYLKSDKPGLRLRDKFYKNVFRAVHLKGMSYGASIRVVEANKDVLIIWVGEKGYHYKRRIKYHGK